MPIIKTLLAADPELVNKILIIEGKKYSPLMFAVEQNPIDYKVIEFLLESGANANFQNNNLEFGTPFAKVCAGNDNDVLAIMELLQKYGADINAIDGSYLTPLGRTLLSTKENLTVVNFFFKNNITLNTLNADGHNMLTLASKNCNIKFVQKACETYKLYGIDVNIGDKDGNTPLH